MRKTVWHLGLLGFAVTTLGGTLLHFLYEWSGNAVWLAPFSGVNESTFEHMKLLFWPSFLFALIESFFFKDRKDFFCIKLKGIFLGLILIPVLFYTYNGVIGKSPDWINIAIFFICAAVMFIYETKLLNKEYVPCVSEKWALFFLIVIGILFAVFTFNAPEIGIFIDPVTGNTGI